MGQGTLGGPAGPPAPTSRGQRCLHSTGPWAQTRPPTGKGCAGRSASEPDTNLSLSPGPPRGAEHLRDVVAKATEIDPLQRGVKATTFPCGLSGRGGGRGTSFRDQASSSSWAGSTSGDGVPSSLLVQASPGGGPSGALALQPPLPESGAAGSHRSSKCHLKATIGREATVKVFPPYASGGPTR